MAMKNRCFACGCLETISICDVKDKMEASWRHLDKVKIIVPLMLHYCSNCGNTPMYSEDIDMMDKAIEKSLAIKALQNVYLVKKGELYRVSNENTRGFEEDIHKADLIEYDEANKLEYEHSDLYSIPLYSELLNKKVDTGLFINLARLINEQQRQVFSKRKEQ